MHREQVCEGGGGRALPEAQAALASRHPTATLTLDSQPLEPVENEFLLCPSVCATSLWWPDLTKAGSFSFIAKYRISKHIIFYLIERSTVEPPEH